MLVPEMMGQLAASPAGPPLWLPLNLLTPGKVFERPKGPFDGLASDGKPWISPEAILRGRNRLDLDDLH
jgi:hypothetical protein